MVGLFEGSFFCGGRGINLTPPSYFKKNFSNIDITLYIKLSNNLFKVSWKWKSAADIICYELTSLVSLWQENVKNWKNWLKSMKISNIEREIIYIFWTTWGISIKFSGKVWLIIILKLTKKQGFTFHLEDTFFEKPLVCVSVCVWVCVCVGGGGGGQTDLPAVLGLRFVYNFRLTPIWIWNKHKECKETNVRNEKIHLSNTHDIMKKSET